MITRLHAPTPPTGWNSWNSFATTNKTAKLRDLWTRKDLAPARGVVRQKLVPHGSALLRVVA
jgi:hypothetical protein